MTETTLTRKHVFLETAQVEALEAISAETGASFAWLVREAVRKYLAQRHPEKVRANHEKTD